MVVVGGPPGKVTASLRLFGTALEPDEITNVLGAHPSLAYRAGDPIGGRSPGVRKTGAWILRSNTDDPDLTRAIRMLLSRVSGDLSVWRQLAERYEVSVFCGVWLESDNAEVLFSPLVLRELSDRGLELDLDMYSVDD